MSQTIYTEAGLDRERRRIAKYVLDNQILMATEELSLEMFNRILMRMASKIANGEY